MLPLWTRGGPSFAYVFACEAEDLAKVGYTRDPLARLHALHPRWYEFFDPGRSLVVATENVHDARQLEREMKRRLRAHAAPVPLTINPAAGGETEWFRGVDIEVETSLREWIQAGWRVDRPITSMLRAELLARATGLREWCSTLAPDELEAADPRATPALRRCADHLDAHLAFGIALEPWLDAPTLEWHRRASRVLPGLRADAGEPLAP